MYRRGVLLLALVCATLVPVWNAEAIELTNPAFQWTWDRTDDPVEAGEASRTWIWGPAYTDEGYEPYLESPGGEREVQYFDKSRMEITDPAGDVFSDWYVTNGLLVVELITGDMQLGDNTFEYHGPAYVNVAGDADDADAVKYVTFNLIDDTPAWASEPIGDFLWSFGHVEYDPALAALGVDTAHQDPVTGHWIARPFWEFMNSEGVILDDIFGFYIEDQLFPDPLFATGRPITRAYWTNVDVGGTAKDVLLQCFERRCLTYTPDNPAGWQVEAGNVGQHYYNWRYGSDSPPPPPPPTDPPPPPPSNDDGAPSEGGVLYDKPMSQWPSSSDGWGNQGYPSGSEYQINLQPLNVFFTFASAGSASFGDASYSVDVRRPSAFGISSPCMALRGTLDSWYELCLTFDDQSLVAFALRHFEWIDSSNFREEILLTSLLEGGGSPQDWHNLKVISEGNEFWVYIDGVYMGSVEYGGNAGVSPIGIGGINHEEGLNVTLAYRNFIVRSIE